jgi:hypothetical protein
MRSSSAMLRADCLLGVARQLCQEGRHAASTEVEEPRPYRLDGDTCHLVVHRPDLQLGGPSAGGLTDQVVALGDVRRAPTAC